MAKWKRKDMRVCVAINRDECGVSLTPNALRNRTQRRHRYQPKSNNFTTLSPVVTQNADGIDFLAEKYTHSNTRSLNSLSSANKTFAFIATEIARIFDSSSTLAGVWYLHALTFPLPARRALLAVAGFVRVVANFFFERWVKAGGSACCDRVINGRHAIAAEHCSYLRYVL